MEAERLRDLERDVREMANNAAELARQIAFVNPGHEPTLALMASEMDAIAARLAEPRGEAAAPGPYSTVHTPDLAERVEMARAFVDANSPQYVAPTDAPSEDDLRVFGLGINRIESWPPHYRARSAWRWCRARMAAAPRPATVEEIAGIIRARNHAGNNRQLLWLDPALVAREIAARIPAPAVPAEIVERAKAVVRNLPSTPHMDLVRGSYPTTLAKLEFAADFARTIAAQPAPAPDPRAVELAKRIPADRAKWSVSQILAWALDAAAYVRRAAGERGA